PSAASSTAGSLFSHAPGSNPLTIGLMAATAPPAPRICRIKPAVRKVLPISVPVAVMKTAVDGIRSQVFQGLSWNRSGHSHPIATRRSALERSIDGGRRLPVVLAEEMGVDVERDRRRRVPEPPGDRHYVNARVDQLASVGMAQPVE